MANQKPGVPKASAQAYLDIEEVKEGVAILKDGSMRAVIMVSSINFDLKSEDERNAIIGSFQGFLNSLNFALQIEIVSKKIDLDEYLITLEDLLKKQDNQLLKIQTSEYIAYIQELLEQVNIMDKSFFVVIPYYPNVLETKGLMSKILPKKSKVDTSKTFESDKIALMDRVDVVVSGLKSVGLNSASLDTQNLIQLFYQLYNPDTSRSQKMQDTKDLLADMVEKGTGEKEPEHLEI